MSVEEREKAEGELEALLKELRDLEDRLNAGGRFDLDVVGGILGCILSSVDTASLKALNIDPTIPPTCPGCWHRPHSGRRVWCCSRASTGGGCWGSRG